MPVVKYYKVNTDELTAQMDKLAIQKNVSKECLTRYRKRNFIASYFRCKATGQITSATLHKFKHIGVDVSKIISPHDFDFIFGK